jgi:uncharacterized membrane protein HdeD (DUF308 family)
MTKDANALLCEQRGSLALRSAAAVLFAIACFWPTIAEAMLIRLFAAYAFLDGIVTLSSGGWKLSSRPVWPLLTGGCVDLAAALAAYACSGTTLLDLVSLMTIWAIALGTTFTVACATLRQADSDYLLLLSGIASGLFARALLSYTQADIVVISTWMGLYSLTLGILILKLTLQRYQLVALDLSAQ